MLPLQQKATVAKKKNRMGIFDFFVIAVLVLLTFAIAYPIYYTSGIPTDGVPGGF